MDAKTTILPASASRHMLRKGYRVMRWTAVIGSVFFASAFLPLTPAVAEDGDPLAGKRVFARCTACHDATAERDRVGPHLVGVVGRTAGSLESFESRYSDDMKQAGEDGLVWDEANLEAYLRDPRAVIPRGTMAFAGLRTDKEIADVIAYLMADPKP